MIYIIFRPLQHIHESLVPLCLEFVKRMRDNHISLPVAWNIPMQTLQDNDRILATYLSRRGAEYGDMLLFPGRAGKPHHTLTINQVKRELHNFSGDFPLPVWNSYFPYSIDINRPELIRNCYEKTSLLIEGITSVYHSTRNGVREYPLLLNHLDQKSFIRAVKKASAKTAFFLLEPTSVSGIMDYIEKLEFLQSSDSVFPLAEYVPSGFADMDSLEEILGYVLPYSSEFLTEAELPHEWNIIANMPGTVTLEDGDLAVRFNRGNLNGIKKGKRTLIPDMEAGGYILRNGHPEPFSTESSFSFSGETQRGLRDRTSILLGPDIPPWVIIRDYYFDENSDDLHISLWWKADQIPEDTSKISILDIPVALINERCEFSYRDLHGEDQTLTLTRPQQSPGNKILTFAGDRFSFKPDSADSPCLTFIFRKPTERAIVELKIFGKKADHCLVSFSPGGYVNPRRFCGSEGIQERIDFFLSSSAVFSS